MRETTMQDFCCDRTGATPPSTLFATRGARRLPHPEKSSRSKLLILLASFRFFSCDKSQSLHLETPGGVTWSGHCRRCLFVRRTLKTLRRNNRLRSRVKRKYGPSYATNGPHPLTDYTLNPSTYALFILTHFSRILLLFLFSLQFSFCQVPPSKRESTILRLGNLNDCFPSPSTLPCPPLPEHVRLRNFANISRTIFQVRTCKGVRAIRHVFFFFILAAGCKKNDLKKKLRFLTNIKIHAMFLNKSVISICQ